MSPHPTDRQEERLRTLSEAEVKRRDQRIRDLAVTLYYAHYDLRLHTEYVEAPPVVWDALPEADQKIYKFAARSILGRRVG
jgi:hypothetical protein